MRRLTSGGWATLLLLLVLGSSFFAPPAGAADRLAWAIDTAGRQRMLTERIAKSWCLLGLDNRNREPRQQLFDAIERFEEQLAELDAFLAEHPRVRPGLEDLRRRWEPFEQLASSEPERAKAIPLLGRAEQVVQAAERLVQALTALAGSEEARILALAGRQRMLTQRLVKAYAYLSWGFDDPQVHGQFIDAWNDFEAVQADLERFPGNTPRLTTALAHAAESWGWLKSALSLYREDVFYPGIIDHAGEGILAEMEEVTPLYQSLLITARGR